MVREFSPFIRPATTIALSFLLFSAGSAISTQALSQAASPIATTEEASNTLLTRKPEHDRRRIRRSIYAGFGIGASQLEPDTSEVPGWEVDDPGNRGNQFTLGVDLSRQLSLELHRSDLGSAGLSPRGRISYDVTAASALLYAGKNRHNYRRHGLTGYGRLGLGYLENREIGNVEYQQDNGTHLLYGLGVEYMTRTGLGVRADLISFDKDVNYAQLGLIYRLGRRERRQTEPFIVQAPEPAPAIAPVAAFAIDPCAKLEGVLHGVNFANDSAKLTHTSESKLNEVAQTLKHCASASVVISGHTDNIGSVTYNKQLSMRRTESVMSYLTSRGVTARRLQAKAFGESQPIATNDTPAGREFNRRVELSLSK